MRKLSEIKNEDALDVLGDILEPVIEICADPKVRHEFDSHSYMGAIKVLAKEHKKSVIEILAILEGVPVEEYEVNVVQIPIKLMELFNDEEMLAFFQSQGLNLSDAFSGSATESIEEKE